MTFEAIHPYEPVRSEEDFQELFRVWPNVGPTVRWWRRPSDRNGVPFHAIGPNRKTACGLTVPAVEDVVGMEAWGTSDCANCRATWTVGARRR
jgi:hypothetical protein